MAQNEAGRTGEQEIAVISAGILVTGNIECDGAIQINGRVDGEVRCATVFVDQGGTVDGAIHAERLRVAGVANGSINANDLAIEDGGSVSGETSYERIKIASGGAIEGSFTRRSRAQRAEPEAPVKLVTSAPTDNPRRVYID